ncbi:hypothetical protein GCM10011585_05280 [Edaphobacter dinghuensis]|uniref:Uncharacterized protein n=1 Tax=Edaphobacter dinghuensis TaxID=1560005 RepID=A0A917H3L6_9BACT|nr:hypothetical protein GCM10011585_05280 [Edaphobacter dinghuensis]
MELHPILLNHHVAVWRNLKHRSHCVTMPENEPSIGRVEYGETVEDLAVTIIKITEETTFNAVQNATRLHGR